MHNKIRFDIYTILIIAIVPTFLAIAWGLTWNDDRATAQLACKNTGHYLTEVGDMASLYTSAGTLGNADGWLTKLQTIHPSGPTRDLHDSVVSSITYGMNVNPDLSTTEPAAVYDQLSPFQQAIDKGREDIVSECPQFESLLSYAFPMFFKETP